MAYTNQVVRHAAKKAALRHHEADRGENGGMVSASMLSSGRVRWRGVGGKEHETNHETGTVQPARRVRGGSSGETYNEWPVLPSQTQQERSVRGERNTRNLRADASARPPAVKIGRQAVAK